MKKILLFILVFISIVVGFTFYKISIVKKKLAKEVITINSIYEKEGKPIDILNIKKEDFITYFKVSCNVLTTRSLVCEVPLNIKNKIKINTKFISDNKISGKVVNISNTINFDNALYKVYLSSNNNIEDKILPVYIEDKVFKNSIKIPRVSVLEVGANFYVWVLEADNKVKLKKITYSLINDFNEILVNDGLEAKDKIVISGKELLEDNDFVKVNLEY